MKKILAAAVIALPLAVFAANPAAPATAGTAPKTAAPPAGVTASGKNQSDYKAKMALCQQQAKGLAGEKKQKAITACMHA